MSKVATEMNTRCELALMGRVAEVRDNSEVVPMTQYILSAMGIEKPLVENFLEDSICHYQNHKVKYIVCNTVMDMKCITYLLESEASPDSEEYYPAPFKEDYGTGTPCAFCYVFNTESDWCSEFGDCFFKKKSDGFYHRVS